MWYWRRGILAFLGWGNEVGFPEKGGGVLERTRAIENGLLRPVRKLLLVTKKNGIGGFGPALRKRCERGEEGK